MEYVVQATDVCANLVHALARNFLNSTTISLMIIPINIVRVLRF